MTHHRHIVETGKEPWRFKHRLDEIKPDPAVPQPVLRQSELLPSFFSFPLLLEMTVETCTPKSDLYYPVVSTCCSVYMVVWRRPDFLLPVELIDLPHQCADICPPCPVYRRDPARPQISVTVNQELHVRR